MTRSMVAAVLIVAAPVAFAQETFDVDFSAGPETVTGTLSLAAGTVGTVGQNEILGYTISSALGDPVQFTVTGSGASGMGPGLFSVQGGELLFTPLPFEPASPCNTCDDNPLQLTTLGNVYSGAVDFAGPGFDGYPGDHGGDGYAGEPGGMSVAGYPIDGSAVGEGNWAIPTDTVLGSDPQLAGDPVDPQPAPEIDPSGAVAALTPLLGALAASARSELRMHP